MKQIVAFVLSGIMGGLIVFGGIQLTTQQTPTIQQALPQLSNNFNSSSSSSNVPFDFKSAAAISRPAVVHISAASEGEENYEGEDNPYQFFEDLLGGGGGPQQGTGSGVIYTPDGYIVTNNHVVEFADKLTVTLSDNRTFNAQIVGTYPQADLAVLKIEAEGLPTLQLANSDTAEVGEWVLAVGNPFNLTSTVTAGIISAKGRSIDAIRTSQQRNDAIESFIQTDAAVNPGNSGGALVDSKGKLLGINTAIATRTGSFAGYSFAIPVNLVKRITDDLIEFGDYKRGMLGVNITPVDSEDVRRFNLDITQGVLIERVMEESAAEQAGLLQHDIIVQVDGRTINSVPELQEMIGRAQVGDIVQLKVYRNGIFEDISVRLKAG